MVIVHVALWCIQTILNLKKNLKKKIYMFVSSAPYAFYSKWCIPWSNLTVEKEKKKKKKSCKATVGLKNYIL